VNHTERQTKSLSKDQLMRLAYDLTEQKPQPVDRIIMVGDEGDCMYIVEAGEAGAYIDGVGRWSPHCILPGQTLPRKRLQ